MHSLQVIDREFYGREDLDKGILKALEQEQLLRKIRRGQETRLIHDHELIDESLWSRFGCKICTGCVAAGDFEEQLAQALRCALVPDNFQ